MKLPSILPKDSFEDRPTNPWSHKNRGSAYARQRKMKSARKWVIAAIVAMFGLAGILVLVRAKVLTVKTVVVEAEVTTSPSVVPTAQFQQAAQQLSGQSLLFLSTGPIEQSWLKKFPSLKSVEIEKKYPDQLTVTYLPRVALCQLVAQDGTYLVDRTGFVFAKASIDRLPKLTVDKQSFAVGATLSINDVVLGLRLVDGLRSLTPKLVSAVLHDQQIDIQLAGPPLIFVGTDKSPDDALSKIFQLMNKFAVDNKYPKELDLRFDRPVVRY